MKRLYIFTAITAAMLTAACTSDPEPQQSAGKLIGVGMTPASIEMWEGERSRADEHPPMVSDMPDDIGVFASMSISNDGVFNNQRMYYRLGDAVKTTNINITEWPASNDWPYDPKKEWSADASDYKFYAYSPWSAQPNGSDGTGYTESYANFNSLTIGNIPPLSANDYMIADKMYICNSEETATRQPLFEMKHLMSRLTFNYKIGEKYDELRDIRLKKVMIDDRLITLNMFLWRCNITFDAAGNRATTTFAPTATPYTRSTDGLELISIVPADHSGLPGVLLTTDYSHYASLYVARTDITGLNLSVTTVYDVYDEKGQLLRSDQKATNIIPVGTKFGTLTQGHYYDINIVVSPKYLYILSDNDTMPDGIIDLKE